MDSGNSLWEKIVSNTEKTFAVTAITLNLALLPLIAFTSGKEIGSYKVLLFFYTSIAVIYSCIALLIQPVYEPSEHGWLAVAKVQRVPQQVGSYLLCLFSTCYVKLLLMLMYSFIYRFCVMCVPHELRWFKKPIRIAILVAIFFVLVALCAGSVIGVMRQNEDIAENFEKDGEYSIDLRTMSYIGAPIYKDGHLVLSTAVILTLWSSVIMGSSGVSIYCIYNIIGKFREAVGITDANSASRRTQHRLFLLLLLQTLVPMIFTFIPSLLSYTLAILQIRSPIISMISSAFFSFAQVIDPILIFCMISDYRRPFVYIFRKYVLRRFVGTSVSSYANWKTSS